MLTLKLKSDMAAFISKLQGRDRLNLCRECHKLYSCGHEHNILLFEMGTCTLCGKKDRVVNCAIANKVVHDKINLLDYWREGKKLA